MHSLVVEPSAEGDLKKMLKSSDLAVVDDAGFIMVVLEEIEADQDFLDRMWKRHEWRQEDPTVEADQVVSLWRTGRNLLRLKMWDFPERDGVLLRWRVIYAYDARTETYHVLGIIDRKTNYDRSHPHIQRIICDYDALGIPTY